MAIVAPTANKEELRERIFNAVQDMYTDVAQCPTKGFHFPTGRPACEFLGYPHHEIDAIPQSAVESFAGVGYPFQANAIKRGDAVLDIGSGAGTDILVAAHLVGPEGTVYGLDFTDAMIEKAQKNIELARAANVRLMKGNAESIPLADERVDVVTSNGVLNLVPDKSSAFQEIYRVLTNGGFLQLSDIVLARGISERSRSNPQLWAECIVGAMPEEVYVDAIRAAGFSNVNVLNRTDYFAESPSESTKNAARQYGALSLTIVAQKL